MRFSLRRLLGAVTLVCVALGATITLGPRSANPAELIRGFLAVILVVETVAAMFAACDPWVGFPTSLEIDPTRLGDPMFVAGTIARTLSVLNGVLFLFVGGFAAMLIVEDGWSMDTGGASLGKWIRGSALIATTCIGSFARGASLVGFIALISGCPLGRRWATMFGLCGASFVALLLWRITGVQGILMSGIVGILALLAGWRLANWRVGRTLVFGRRARRWGARSFLVGLVLGSACTLIPGFRWLLFWNPPVSVLLGALIGSSLGATIGLLVGASAAGTYLEAERREPACE